jgi:hypothetical protein
MIEYTKDNYLYGTGSGDTWYVNIDPPKRKVRTYYEETITAVEYVYENKTDKFTVLLSGGFDSQYVCEVLLRLGISFDVVIINYLNSEKESYNLHDIKWAYEFCLSRNLNPKTIDIDFDKLVNSGKAVDVAKSIQCCSSTVAYFLSVLDQIDGFILLGNDPPYIRYEKDKNIWVLEELQYIHSLLRYFEKNQIPGCPFLLSYTPEMMLSFLLDPSIFALGTGEKPGKLGSNSTKSYVFNNGSNFNMPIYDFKENKRIKLTGFENIWNAPISQHPNLKIFKDFFVTWNGEYLEPYNDVIKRLSLNQT